MLTRLVYLSTAAELLNTAQLEALLGVSRANNQRDGISGLLLYDDGNFIQAVEGDEAAVAALFARIAADPRHHDIRVVSREQVAGRMFADWAMAAGRLDRVALLPLRPADAEGAATQVNIAAVMLNVFLRNAGGHGGIDAAARPAPARRS